jgi:hypothetical protein
VKLGRRVLEVIGFETLARVDLERVRIARGVDIVRGFWR